MIGSHSADVRGYWETEGVQLYKLKRRLYDFDIEKLLNGEIDAVSTYVTDAPFLLKKRNFEYTTLSPTSGRIDFYGDLLSPRRNSSKTSLNSSNVFAPHR